MACLDTTFLIDILRGKKEIEQLNDELDKNENTLYISSVSIMELWSGANLSKSSKEKQKVNDLLNSLEVLIFDETSAKEAGEIEVELLKKGEKIQTEDIMIAATTIINGERLVTRDKHYAKIEGLKIIKY